MDVKDSKVRAKLRQALTNKGVAVEEIGGSLWLPRQYKRVAAAELTGLFNPVYDRSLTLPDRPEMTASFGEYLLEGGVDIEVGGQIIKYRSEDSASIYHSMQEFYAFRLPQLDAEMAPAEKT